MHTPVLSEEASKRELARSLRWFLPGADVHSMSQLRDPFRIDGLLPYGRLILGSWILRIIGPTRSGLAHVQLMKTLKPKASYSSG